MPNIAVTPATLSTPVTAAPRFTPNLHHARLLVLISALLLSFVSRGADAPHLVFAHYMVCCPSYGDGADSYRREIQSAQAAGIDGFALNCGSWSSNPNYMLRAAGLYRAALELGTNFKLFFSADMCCSVTAADIKDMVRTYAAHPNQLMRDGKPVLSTYSGEALGKTWWRTQVLDPLWAENLEVFFLPYFRPTSTRQTMTAELVTTEINGWWKDVMDGYFYFGAAGLPNEKTPSLPLNGEAYASAMHASGRLYMGAVAPQYWGLIQSGGRRYFEFSGGEGLAAQWMSIVDTQHPQWVEMLTWNDFNEATWFSPVDDVAKYTGKMMGKPVGFFKNHAGLLELNKYFIQWYKTGSPPVVKDDGVFFFYRTHPKDAVATNDPRGPVSTRFGDVQDNVYATTVLTQPAELRITTGTKQSSFAVPAGLNHVRMPFQPGTVCVELWRDGVKLASVLGDNILESIQEYNFQYTSGFAYAKNSAAPMFAPRDSIGTLSPPPDAPGSADTPPLNPLEFTSPPTATPSPDEAGLIQFSATAATGTIAWDFGDGSTAAGASVVHVYTAPGNYTVMVTLTDPQSGLVTAHTVSLAVNSGAPAAPEREGGEPREIKQWFFKLIKKDQARLSGFLRVPENFKTCGQKVVLTIGAVRQIFLLNSKGQAKQGSSSFSLKLPRKMGGVGQLASFKATLAGIPADFNAASPLDASGVAVRVQYNNTYAGGMLGAKFSKAGAKFLAQ